MDTKSLGSRIASVASRVVQSLRKAKAVTPDGGSDAAWTLPDDPDCDLLFVLRSSEARESFRQFCRQVHGQESIEFWLDVEGLHDRTDEAAASLVEVRRIHDTYIVSDGPSPVNISHSDRIAASRLVAACIASGRFAPDIFDKCQSTVFDLMQRDLFVRFVSHNRSAVSV